MPQTEFVAPNLWSLSGGGIHVRYWTFTLGPIRHGDSLLTSPIITAIAR